MGTGRWWMVGLGLLDGMWHGVADMSVCEYRSDDKTAAEYSLEGGATLHLVLALRGGRA